MERDPLQDFINNNREAFEESFDEERSWEQLQSRESKPALRKVGPAPSAQKSRDFGWLRMAAMMVMVAGMTYLITKQNEQSPTVNNHYHLTMGDISPELAEVEHYYTSSIAEKLTEIKTMQVDQSMMEELTLIDQQGEMLDKEMQNNVNNEAIVKAIIKNYRIKLNLLEEMLDDLNTYKNQNNDRKTKIIEL